LSKDGTPPLGRIYALIGLMVFCWSINYVIGKVALREIDAVLASGLRTIAAWVMLLPLFVRKLKRGEAPRHYTRADWKALLFLGMVGVAGNQFCFVVGLGRTSVAHSSITMGLTPLFTLLIAAAVGLERLTAGKVAGMAVALSGIGVLNLARTGGQATLAGDLLILGAGLSFALYTVVGKAVTARFGSITVNTFAYGGASLVLLPATIWSGRNFHWSTVSLKAWLSLGFMALFPSLICYLIFYYALNYIPASRLSAFTYVQPLAATLMAVPLLGEPLTAGLAAGGALVVGGVYLSERAR
jgi:drug/metabolite transporter (DMT)-like permease